MYEMMAYEQDPDVVRWGLQDLEVCCHTSGGCRSSVTQYETDSSTLGYAREGFNEPVTVCVKKEDSGKAYVEIKNSMAANVENDVVIAQLLQEELSRVALAEASGYQCPGQAAVIAQEWSNQQKDHGQENGENEKEDEFNEKEGKKTRSEAGEVDICVMRDNSQMEENLVQFIDIEEDSSDLDGEVGKRLNQMVSVPHVPKINGKLPSEDEQISDHERLFQRLQLYELVESKVPGDGNCQFRSLSDQLYRSPEHHRFVRDQIVCQLKDNREMYEGYLPMAYNEYLKKMSRSGEWGDHVTLQAAADWFGVRIFMITSFKDTCYIEILPHKQKSNRLICLSFWAEVHYNSIYPEGELPVFEVKKKRKWWPL